MGAEKVIKRPIIGGSNPLLDRLGAQRTVESAYGDQLEAFGELLEDEGLGILQRALYCLDKEPDIPDIVLLASLFRQCLAMLDAVHACLSQGAVYASQPALRAAMEAVFSIEWILEDKEPRALQHYVGGIRSQIKGNERCLSGELRAIAGEKHSDLADLITDKKRDAAEEGLKRLRERLASPPFRDINQSFEDSKGAKWYEVRGGPKSLRGLAQATGNLAEYEFLYGGMSEIAHGTASTWHYSIPEPGEMILKPLRSLEGFDEVLVLATGVVLRALRLIRLEYRPDEIQGFVRRYRERYKDRLRVPSIDVQWQAERL